MVEKVKGSFYTVTIDKSEVVALDGKMLGKMLDFRVDISCEDGELFQELIEYIELFHKDGLNGEGINLLEVIDLPNKQEEGVDTLKEDIETILDYVLHKGKFAMTVKEQKAHNRLRAFVRGD